MLRLDDRLQTALRNGMGVSLTPSEVVFVAGWLVLLRRTAKLFAATKQTPSAFSAALYEVSQQARSAVLPWGHE